MCYWFLKTSPSAAEKASNTGQYASSVYRAYRALLQFVLRRRALTMMVVAGFAGLVVYASRYVVVEFFPTNDRNQFLLYIDLEAGTEISETSRVVDSVSTWLRDTSVNPEVTKVIAYAGSGGPRFFLSLAPIDPDPHASFILVETKSNDQVPEMIERTRAYIDAHYPEARGRPKAMWFGPTETGGLLSKTKTRTVGFHRFRPQHCNASQRDPLLALRASGPRQTSALHPSSQSRTAGTAHHSRAGGDPSQRTRDA